MTEIVFTLIIFLLAGLLVWEKRENKKERERFTNALIAKTSEQFRDLELTSKVKPITPPIKNDIPDLVPEAELTDQEFDRMIKGV